MAAAVLHAYRVLAANLPEAEIARLISIGAYDTIIQSVLSERILDIAFRRVQQQSQRHITESIKYAARDLPKGGKIGGELAIRFDYLSPHVQTAIRELDDKILPTLKSDVRESVRQHILAGIEAGKNPKAIAKGIREVVGLSPSQELAVRNYRAELEAGSKAAASRALHDSRFKVTDGMTPEKIDRMVNIYRRNMQAFHAETISRTATLDAFKKGQQLAYQQAIDQGIIDPSRAQKTWITVGDDRVRDEHILMQGETVPFNALYSNGEEIPGESTFNCRCISRFSQARAA